MRERTSKQDNYDDIINQNQMCKRSYRDSLFNYIMTMLPSEHVHSISKFCNAALLEAYKNGKNKK